MDVVVTGRHIEISEGFREHVADKLAKLEKHDHRIMRVAVEVAHERNPRQHDRAIRVQLTARSRGPVIRAEAAADDKMAAFEQALDKMAAQMRRAADRRRVQHDRRRRVSTAQAFADGPPPVEEVETVLEVAGTTEDQRSVGPITVMGDGPLVVRAKSHTAAPMTLDQALYKMELVGHDFYLFIDKESEKPSVVYRRKGYDYGVIALDVDG